MSPPIRAGLTLGSEKRAARMGRVPLRPVVPIELIGPMGRQRTVGLVGSSSEHAHRSLAGPGNAERGHHEFPYGGG